RLELAARERQLFRLRLVLPTREDLDGLSPDSRLALTLAPNPEKKNDPFWERAFIRLWDQGTQQPYGQRIPRSGTPRTADHYGDRAIAAGGKTLLTRVDDNTLQLYRAETGAPVGEPLRLGNACWAW